MEGPDLIRQAGRESQHDAGTRFADPRVDGGHAAQYVGHGKWEEGVERRGVESVEEDVFQEDGELAADVVAGVGDARAEAGEDGGRVLAEDVGMSTKELRQTADGLATGFFGVVGEGGEEFGEREVAGSGGFAGLVRGDGLARDVDLLGPAARARRERRTRWRRSRGEWRDEESRCEILDI